MIEREESTSIVLLRNNFLLDEEYIYYSNLKEDLPNYKCLRYVDGIMRP
jgi:hypothetical protein